MMPTLAKERGATSRISGSRDTLRSLKKAWIRPCALRRFHQFQKQPTFLRHAFIEIETRRELDRVDGFQRRDLAARLAGPLCPGLGECGLVGGRMRQIADAPRRRVALQKFSGIGKTGGTRISFRDTIDEADLKRLFRRYRIPSRNDLERRGNADKTRQPLRAARPRDQAELDLGKSEPGAGDRQPVMRPQGDLAPAAQSRAVDGRDHGLRRALDMRADVGQEGFLRRLAEFGDVGTADEQLAVSHDQRDLRVVPGEAIDRRPQPLPDRLPKRVHRRIGNGDHRHRPLAFISYNVRHSALSSRFPGPSRGRATNCFVPWSKAVDPSSAPAPSRLRSTSVRPPFPCVPRSDPAAGHRW